jgi:hypothetical protein
MRTFLTLFLTGILGLVFALPAPQQIATELDKPFSVQGLDTTTFEAMTFFLSSVTLTADNPQVMLEMTLGESEDAELLMLETSVAASIEVGDYTLTLLSASVPEDADMSCAVSTATLVLKKTEKPL